MKNEEKEDLSDEEKEKANNIVDVYSEKIQQIEENYNKQAIPIAQRLTELPIEDQVKTIEEDKGTLEKNLDVAIFGEVAYKKDDFSKVGKKYQNYFEHANEANDWVYYIWSKEEWFNSASSQDLLANAIENCKEIDNKLNVREI